MRADPQRWCPDLGVADEADLLQSRRCGTAAVQVRHNTLISVLAGLKA